jgi:hypothetical protein
VTAQAGTSAAAVKQTDNEQSVAFDELPPTGNEQWLAINEQVALGYRRLPHNELISVPGGSSGTRELSLGC